MDTWRNPQGKTRRTAQSEVKIATVTRQKITSVNKDGPLEGKIVAERQKIASFIKIAQGKKSNTSLTVIGQ